MRTKSGSLSTGTKQASLLQIGFILIADGAVCKLGNATCILFGENVRVLAEVKVSASNGTILAVVVASIFGALKETSVMFESEVPGKTKRAAEGVVTLRAFP